MIRKSKIIKVTELAILCTMSIILLLLLRIPIIFNAPFLKYDPSDIPIVIGVTLFDLNSGFKILLAVTLIQGFLFSGSGIVGMIMHLISSGIFIALFNITYKLGNAIIKVAMTSAIMTLLIIPINYIFMKLYLGIPTEVIKVLILSATIPFNLIKFSLNSALSILFIKIASNHISKEIK